MKGDAERMAEAILDERTTQIFFDMIDRGLIYPMTIDLVPDENLIRIRERAGCYLVGTLGITESQGGRVYIAVEGRTGTYGVIFDETAMENLKIRGHDP